MPRTAGKKVLCHFVTYNNSGTILKAVESVLAQRFVHSPVELTVEVTDNASRDTAFKSVQEEFHERVKLFQNSANLGFCAAHNQAAKRFLEGSFDFLFLINPDLRLEPDAIEQLIEALMQDPQYGMATPKLYRADAELNPLSPRTLDACGMVFDRSLRHFDRGSGEIDHGAFDQACTVFGGTGAALLFRRECVEQLLLIGERFETDLDRIYPQLAHAREERAPLFDEAFFAYREDAELAWRAQGLGWKCRYVPSAVGYHVRVVLPERRSQLPAEFNAWSVRNRFLMQLVNFSWRRDWTSILPGLMFRNLVVILGVIFIERSSIQALREVWQLRRRAKERRRILFTMQSGQRFAEMSRTIAS